MMYKHKLGHVFMLVFLFALSWMDGDAQNIIYKARVDRLYGGVCGDCVFCGGPDNHWYVAIRDNNGSTSNSIWDYARDNDDCGWRNYSNANWRTNTNAAYGTSVIASMTAFEDDGGSWGGGNDGNCGSAYLDVNTVNITNNAPCTWKQYTGSRVCSGANWQFEWSIYWEYNQAPTLSGPTPLNQLKCQGSAATALTVTSNTDGNGRSMARWYKWQIASTVNGPWTDISGTQNGTANSAITSLSYTPAQISGTRYYRCLATSNCSADFTSLTATSSVYTVTYAFNTSGAYGGGDAAPAIQTGVCGSTILPSQLITFNALSSNTVAGSALNASFAWTATGGSPASGSASSFAWTAPTATGTYTISLTYNYSPACSSPVTVTCNVTVGSPNCNYAYVAPTGTNTTTSGGPSNPYATIAYAISQLSGRDYIRVSAGTINETSIINIPSNVTIEGGYVVTAGNWVKSFDYTNDKTIVNGPATLETITSVTPNVSHTVTMKAVGVTNWKLIDLTIRSANATGTAASRGCSSYGLYLNNTSGYNVIRCDIRSGNASAGAAGSAGAVGHTGGNGAQGNTNSSTSTATTTGGAGGSGGSNAWGCNGGNGGAGGSTCGNSCGSAGSAGAAGQCSGGAGGAGGAGTSTGSNCSRANGGTGTSATDYPVATVNTTGINGGTAANSEAYGVWYTPSGQGLQGGHGRAGGGGGGGGASRGENGSFISCVANSGNGGSGGGQGGGGGEGGDGGFGGGGSFGIYRTSNAATGTFTDMVVTSGTAGSGGAGGAGGNGGTGGSGGPAQGNNSGDRATSGAGGAGADGAKGGAGQTGAAGSSSLMYTQGTGASNPSGTIPTTPVVKILTDNRTYCRNSVITLDRTTGSGNWAFSNAAIAYVNNLTATTGTNTATSDPVNIYSTTQNIISDITVGSTTYAQGLSIEGTVRPLPVLSLNYSTICVGGSVTASFTETAYSQSNVDYLWEVFSGTQATGSAVFNSNLQSPTFGPFTTSGTYTIRFQVKEICCGWSIPRFITLTVNPDATPPTDIVFSSPASGADICVGSTINVSGASGGTGGFSPYTYEYVYDNGSGFGTYSTTLPSFVSQEGSNNVKVRIAANLLRGCEVSTEYSETITGRPIPVGVAGVTTQEICSGQVADISFTTSNAVSGTTFAWTRTNTTTVTGLPASGSGDISAALTSSSAVAQTVTFTIVPTGPAPTFCSGSSFTSVVVVNPNPSASPTNNGPLCEGGTIILTGGASAGTAPYTYAWTGPSSFTGSGSPLNRTSSTVAMSGAYGLTVTDNKGCTATGSTTVSVVADPTISVQPVGTTICAGTSYAINTSVSNGTGLTYQWQYSTNGSLWSNVGANLPVSGFSYSGQNTPSMIITTTGTTAASSTYQFRCSIGSGLGCDPNPLITSAVTLNLVPAVINSGYRTWTGMVSNSWLNGLNWDCGGVPTIATDVIIPVSVSTGRYPIILSSEVANCRTFELQGPPSDIEIQDGGTLHVASP